MKTIAFILVFVSTSTFTLGQRTTSKKEHQFTNQTTGEISVIRPGLKAFVETKTAKQRLSGFVLAITDSSLFVGTRREQAIVNFSNVKSLKVTVPKLKSFVVTVVKIDGQKLIGELVLTPKDSMGIWQANKAKTITLNPIQIKTIAIRQKKVVGKSILFSALAAAAIGGVIANSTFKSNPNKLQIYNDTDQIAASFNGAATGLFIGAILGTAMGLRFQRFSIEGDPAHFELFMNIYRYQIHQQN